MLQARRLSTYRSCTLSSCLRRACPISLRRAMHFGVRQTAAAVSAVALIFCCSCEKHHLGEDPEVQKEHVVAPGESDESSGATKEASGRSEEHTSELQSPCNLV